MRESSRQRLVVVFAATPEGNVIALNALTGAPLWHFQTGGSPGRIWHGWIADELLGGRQTIHPDLGGGCAIQFRAA